MKIKITHSAAVVFAVIFCIGSINAQQIPGTAPGFVPGERTTINNSIFVSEPNVKNTSSYAYTTTTYTFNDLIFFSYFDNTILSITDNAGNIVSVDTIDSDQYLASYNSEGIYNIGSNNPFSLLIGDPVSRSVMGYFGVDESGRPLSTRINTFIPDNEYSNEHFILFAYNDNTEYVIKNLNTQEVISLGILHEGEHFVLDGYSNTFVGVTSSKPVSALSYTDQGYYIPSTNGTFAGESFYGFSGKVGNWPNSIVVTAYSDDTEVLIVDTETSDTLAIDTISAGEVIPHVVYDETFWKVTTNKSVTVNNTPYGYYTSGYYYMTRQIDETGAGIGKNFYAPIIAGDANVFSYEDDNEVLITNSQMEIIFEGELNAGEGYYFYSSKDIYHITGTKNLAMISSNGGSYGADFMPLNFSTSLPDFSVSSSDISFSPEDDLAEGDVIEVTADIWNNGLDNVGGLKVRFYNGDPSAKNPISDWMDINIDAQSYETVSISYIVPEYPEYQELYVTVDLGNDVAESNESNNVASRFLVANNDFLPPLALSSENPEFINDDLIETSFFDIEIFLSNTWNTLIEGIWMKLLIDGDIKLKSTQSIADSIFIGDLNIGEATTKLWQVEIEDTYIGENLFYEISVGAIGVDTKSIKRMIPFEGDDMFHGTTDIQNVSDNNLSIYPNPSSGNISIEFKEAMGDNTSIEIYSQGGVLVYKEIVDYSAAKQYNIDLSSLQDGLYFVRIINNNNPYVQKVLLKR